MYKRKDGINKRTEWCFFSSNNCHCICRSEEREEVDCTWILLNVEPVAVAGKKRERIS